MKVKKTYIISTFYFSRPYVGIFIYMKLGKQLYVKVLNFVWTNKLKEIINNYFRLS